MDIKHLLAEICGCNARISEEATLRTAIVRGIEKTGAHILSDAAVNYNPHGLTIVFFLKESHVIATTWPEHNLLLLDVLLCNPSMNARLVLDELVDLLKPSGSVTLKEVVRTVGA